MLKGKRYWISYTFLFVLLAGVIFFPFRMKGSSFLRDGDGFNQFWPAMVYIGQYIRDVFHSGLPLRRFDFTIGLGESVFSSLSYYGFGDIFNLFSAFGTTETMDIVFIVIVLLKLYTAGLTLSWYVMHRGAVKRYALAASLMYAFCNYALVTGLEFYQHLNGFLWLPLMALGIDQIYEAKSSNRNRRIVWPLLLSVFFLAVNGFYYLYMNTVFAVVYVLYKTVQGHKLQRRVFLSFIGNYLLAISLSAAFFLPSIAGYFNSSRTGRSVRRISEFFLYSPAEYMIRLKNAIVPVAWELSLGLPLIGVLTVVFCLLHRKRRDASLAAGLILLTFVPLTGIVCNGFSFDTDRWWYMPLFAVCALAAECLPDVLEQFRIKTDIAIFAVLGLASVLMHMLHTTWLNRFEPLRVVWYVLLIGMFMLAFFLCDASRKRCPVGRMNYRIITEALVFLLIIFNVAVNGFLVNATRAFGGSGYSSGFRLLGDSYTVVSDSLAANVAGTSLEKFERIDTYDTSYDSSLLLGYYGTVAYYSVLNNNAYNFYAQFGVSPGIEARHVLKGLDSRRALEALLSVKYYQDYVIQENEDGTEDLKPVLKENEYFLPFGFTYRNYQSLDEFNQRQVPDRQASALQAVVLEDEPELSAKHKEPVGNQSELIEANITAEGVEEENGEFSVSSDSSLTIELKDFQHDFQDGELYVNLAGFKLLSEGARSVYVGNKIIQVRDGSNLYYTGNDDFWINVTELRDNAIRIHFDQAGTYSLDGIRVYWCPTTSFSEDIQNLTEDKLENLSMEKNRITGDLKASQDEILFLSIPFSKGWTAYVDGTRQDLMRANIGFTAMEVEQGPHRVVLTYEDPLSTAGIMITILGILVLLYCIWKEHKEQKRI